MHYFQPQQLHAFLQQQAPDIYEQMNQQDQLEEYLWQSWLWITTEQARAAQEALRDTDLKPIRKRRALAEEAARCATEISLELIADELRHWKAKHASSDTEATAASA